MLYTWINIINQVYFNKKEKKCISPKYTTYFKNNMFENILNMNIDNLKVEE